MPSRVLAPTPCPPQGPFPSGRVLLRGPHRYYSPLGLPLRCGRFHLRLMRIALPRPGPRRRASRVPSSSVSACCAPYPAETSTRISRARTSAGTSTPPSGRKAIRACEEVETATRRFPGAETVLVQVGSVEALRCAYPELLRRHDRLRRRAQESDTEKCACRETIAPHTGVMRTTPCGNGQHGRAQQRGRGEDFRESKIASPACAFCLTAFCSQSA